MDPLIEDLLKYDAIDDAETKYGNINENNEGFVYALDMIHSRSDMLERALSSKGDVYDRMNFDDYLKVVAGAGFVKVLEESFKDREGKDNKFIILWHNDGLLLKLDSFTWSTGKRTINSADLYYNILLTVPYEERYKATSSGGYHFKGPLDENNTNLTDIWIGHHDAREALIYNLNKLYSVGTFLKEWVNSSDVYLFHYMDIPDREVDWNERSLAINNTNLKRLRALPEKISNMLLKVYRNTREMK